MDSNSIIIINHIDEKPHYISQLEYHVKYRYGNVTVKTVGQMSLALVFRVVQQYELCNTANHTLILNKEK